MRMFSGKYKLRKEGEYHLSMFLKLFGRELLLVISISLLFLIELYAFFFTVSLAYLIYIHISMIIVNMILYFIIINTLLYNRKYPNNKKSDSFFILLALMFINLNFLIPISNYIEDVPLRFNETTIYLINIFISLFILGLVVLKLLRYKLQQKKDSNIKKPTIIFYFSSAFTLLFNGLSIASIIIFSAKIIYLLNIIFALMILHLILVKSFGYKIKERAEKITTKVKVIFIGITIFFFTIIGTLITIVFCNTIYFYTTHTDNEIVNSRMIIVDYIWNIGAMYWNILIVSIFIVIILILELKYEIAFDWEGVPKTMYKIDRIF